MRESEEDTEHRVDAKVDILLEKLNYLSAQVDKVSETLAKADAAAVRRAFQVKPTGAESG